MFFTTGFRWPWAVFDVVFPVSRRRKSKDLFLPFFFRARPFLLARGQVKAGESPFSPCGRSDTGRLRCTPLFFFRHFSVRPTDQTGRRLRPFFLLPFGLLAKLGATMRRFSSFLFPPFFFSSPRVTLFPPSGGTRDKRGVRRAGVTTFSFLFYSPFENG